MDITAFTSSYRENALLIGDYNYYRAQLSRRLLTLRKKLGRTSAKGKKYSGRPPVTAQDVAQDHEFVHLLLLTSERAWAHAMHMKSTNSSDNADRRITGSTRGHIVSRLYKAAAYANELLEILTDRSKSGASDIDFLEARAYYSSLVGAVTFEKQEWEACLTSYSEVRIMYSTLSKASNAEVFKDLLSSTVDPSIRYAAYQLRMPRSRPIPTIARNYFPKSDKALLSLVSQLDHTALIEDTAKSKSGPSQNSEPLAKTITWRSRTVDLEDAAIAQALTSVDSSAAALTNFLTSRSNVDLTPKEKAAAYDDVLIGSQDAVDATKRAIDELAAEGVGQGDKRMQALQITRTAVNYDLVGWRVGRNRVLVGDNDGALLEEQTARTPRKPRKDGKEWVAKVEGNGRKLARLRERVVLFDATLQSVDSVKDLPGIAADDAFLQELQSKRNYYEALKCLSIARSHAALSNRKNALALFARALDLSSKSNSPSSPSPADTRGPSSPPRLDISPFNLHFLNQLLQVEVFRHRALVQVDNITAQQPNTASGGPIKSSTIPGRPVVETLDTYPSRSNVGGKSNGVVVDLSNLVTYPPTKLEPVAVKPIFLDVAWNYIEYPGRAARELVHHGERPARGTDGDAKAASKGNQSAEPPQPSQPQKKGWFGFGR
ncbi:MAG: hypothetical protein M1837_003821 [Sclerophora amabilis]|nr:MAG: hypothetical protein M1837_003821 [Sclerophora amabilis]